MLGVTVAFTIVWNKQVSAVAAKRILVFVLSWVAALHLIGSLCDWNHH